MKRESVSVAPGRSTERVRPALIFMALVTLAFVGMRALELYYDHPLKTLDGAMQTWYAVDSFARGQQLGHDFQSYLGTTMIMIIVPVYIAFGGTLFASSIAASIAMALGLIATVHGLLRLTGLFKPASLWFMSALAAAALFHVTELNVGNSLRPLRWALPFMMLPVVIPALIQIRRAMTIRPAIALGVIAGIGLVWSNDTGIPAMTALLIAIVLCGAGGLRNTARAVSACLASAAVASAAIILAATHGAPEAWLRYNFGAVPQDQIWYFAPWARDTRIIHVEDLWLIVKAMTPWIRLVTGLLIVSLAAATLMRLRKRGDAVRLSAFIFLGLSALGISLVPQLGGHIMNGYNYGLLPIGIMAPVIVFGGCFAAWVRRLPQRLRHGSALLKLLCVAGVLVLAVNSGRDTASVVTKHRDGEYVAELGFAVSPGYAPDVAALRSIRQFFDAKAAPHDARLQATYPSAIAMLLHANAPTPFGSIIHALGDENRTRFTNVISERRVLLATTVYSGRPHWPDWNIRATWPYFRALHLNYQPVAQNVNHIIWQRRDTPLPPPSVSVGCETIPREDGSVDFRVVAPFDGHVEIRIRVSTLPKARRSEILTVTEDSPFTRAPDFSAWRDAPRYGLPPSLDHDLFLPVARNQPSSITLRMVGGKKLEGGSCSAVALAWPDLSGLPDLPAYARTLRGETP